MKVLLRVLSIPILFVYCLLFLICIAIYDNMLFDFNDKIKERVIKKGRNDKNVEK